MSHVQLTIAAIIELETLLQGEMLGVGDGALTCERCDAVRAKLAAVRPMLCGDMHAALERRIARVESWLEQQASPEASSC
jgi:hypothetical protein